ncbi:MAG: carbohydrate ABC transporter permease [Deinococcota bacterium]
MSVHPITQRTAKPIWSEVAKNLFGLFVAALFLLPLAWMFLTSLKDASDIFTQPLLPRRWVFGNYLEAWQAAPFGRYLLNSLFVSSSVTTLVMLTSCLAGFALARRPFPGKSIVFFLILGTLMVPFDVLLVPNYITVNRLGLLNTYGALIIPFTASGFGIFLMRQAFKQTPVELEEAARIDGASSLRILFQVFLPVNLAPLSALAVLTFLGAWNALVWPLIVTTRNENIRPVQVGLSSFLSEEGSNIPLMMAATAIVVTPVLIAYALSQKWFIKSAASSGLKG